MEKKIWFEPKGYGWGLAPVCWQGWVATLMYLVLVVLYVVYGYDLFNNIEGLVPSDVPKIIFDVLISGVAFVYMMEDRTSPKVGWYWGNMK